MAKFVVTIADGGRILASSKTNPCVELKNGDVLNSEDWNHETLSKLLHKEYITPIEVVEAQKEALAAIERAKAEYAAVTSKPKTKRPVK